MDKNKL